MTYRTAALTAAAVLSLTGTAAAKTYTSPIAPSYAQRNVDADFTATLPAGAILTIDRACPAAKDLGYAFTESSAYRANGAPMGHQQYNTLTLRSSWSYPGTRTKVTFDGITFRNHTKHRVMVAGWCG
jgi:hypothetical protein